MNKRPGQAVRGSTSGRPIMVLLDVLGKRWTLRVLWVLFENGPMTFRDIQAQCEDMSPTVLNSRLKDLRALRLAEANEEGYCLTAQGKALSKKLAPLDLWANEWAASFECSYSDNVPIKRRKE